MTLRFVHYWEDVAPENVLIVHRPGRIYLRNGDVIKFRKIINILPDKIVVEDLHGNILEIEREKIERIRQ